ncbi:MAG: hypothetical protein AAB692_05050 [Patescibacteria group bacterium]
MRVFSWSLSIAGGCLFAAGLMILFGSTPALGLMFAGLAFSVGGFASSSLWRQAPSLPPSEKQKAEFFEDPATNTTHRIMGG